MCSSDLSALSRIVEMLDTQSDLRDPARPITLPCGGRLSLEFEEVSFAYPATREPVLDNVSLLIRPGEMLAVVGPTGSGKSVIAALAARFYDVDCGRIRVGGVDVKDLSLQSLRGEIGMAFEDAILFSCSVRENLTMGREGISDLDISWALAIAQAEFALDLPEGLDTVLAEQGLSLSGGQRQRLALARALLGRPRILILDDPTSALDVGTEAALEQGLRAAFNDTTILSIARRSSAAALADRVAFLVGGRIMDTGSHAELLERSAAYRNVMLADEMAVSDEAIEGVPNA